MMFFHCSISGSMDPTVDFSLVGRSSNLTAIPALANASVVHSRSDGLIHHPPIASTQIETD
jgi:hypothetical protein